MTDTDNHAGQMRDSQAEEMAKRLEIRAEILPGTRMMENDARLDRKAASLIRSQAERIRVLTEAVEWYGEQARLCRLIHSEGDAGRRALDADGGKRALVALAALKEPK